MSKKGGIFKNLNPKTAEYIGIALRCIVAMTIFLVAVLNYRELTELDVKSILLRFDNTAAVIAAVFVIYIVKACVFVIPASLVYISVGAVLDTPVAIIVNLLGITTELIISYLIGRFLGGDYVNKVLSRTRGGRKLLKKNIQDNKWGVFLMRFASAPLDALSLMYGAAKSSFLPYLALSLLGVAPRVIALTILGEKFFEIIPMRLLMKIGIFSIPFFVAGYLIKKLWYDKKKKKEPSAATKENEDEKQGELSLATFEGTDSDASTMKQTQDEKPILISGAETEEQEGDST